MEKKLRTPISNEMILSLHAGDEVLLTGTIYTARDAAHKAMLETIARHEALPFDFHGQVVYYVGPTPAKPGQAIGASGPTSSYRMDPYAPKLMHLGLKVMIGKGERSQSMIETIKKEKGLYLMAIGGLGALLSQTVTKSEVIAYPQLGTEAIRKLEVIDFPALVAIDAYGVTI